MFTKLRPSPIAGLRLSNPRQQHGSLTFVCQLHNDGRTRSSNFWLPTGGIEKKAAGMDKEDTNDLLIRAGFLRQAYSGIFHMLPLGLRVQDKLEKLIDTQMQAIGASKLSLSSLSSQDLWEKTGRLKSGSEFFRLNDRKESRFLLAPTHEEEITSLVANLVTSYKDLPLRVYQISRKYRDEARPRQGLLRGREFVMKDLYTFDYNTEEAMQTYEAVREAYKRIFDTLKVPYLVATADSGNMGGNLSHEFHLISAKGEDTLISCSACDYVYNEEVSDGRSHHPVSHANSTEPSDTGVGAKNPTAISTGLWTAISEDKKTLVRVWYPKYSIQQSKLGSDSTEEPVERGINSHAIKAVAKTAGVDLLTSLENSTNLWVHFVEKTSASNPPGDKRYTILDLYDSQVVSYNHPPLSGLPEGFQPSKHSINFSMLNSFPGTSDGLDLTRVVSGDKCPKCNKGALHTHKAIELGHTFHLGTRYTQVFGATVQVDSSRIEKHTETNTQKESHINPMQMGCHGIGVSRMISAVADSRSDANGLNWPRAIAPYEILVIPTTGLDADAETIYDTLKLHMDTRDVILDDRAKQVGWKLKDADLIGFPVVVIVGKSWKANQEVEVHCRQLDGLRQNVGIAELPEYVGSLLRKL
ncbi:prolyl-tRNA synthetase [Talaromyces proteolyticus]|uniref:proline--tRNA ligase n=1 Tax=Talaromyces proteolyticus TaxID=1131652 RepID=A0AAD4PW04_9EURO|nr:prolyl-tRNA synthetase [Talaromyces proteolyticus]KAH8697320.1 prolyl-tRNA synthetase [Talaromyces proteolyticus]